MASSEQPETDEQPNVTGVGALLKASRLRLGENLQDIAGVLKIRYVYLEAIEDGRFEDLPGPTYTHGFIRAYAEHLGLDSGEVLRRFKSHELPLEKRAELDFPEPMPETAVPGGAVILLGVVLVLLAYGGLQIYNAEDGFFADLISPLPERLARMSGNQPAPAPAPAAASENAEKAEKADETVEKPESSAPAASAPAETAGMPLENKTEGKPKTEPEASTMEEPAAKPEPEAAATEQAVEQAEPDPKPNTPPSGQETEQTTAASEPAPTEAPKPVETPKPADEMAKPEQPVEPAPAPAPEAKPEDKEPVTASAPTPEPAPAPAPAPEPTRPAAQVPMDMIPSSARAPSAATVSEAATATPAPEPASEAKAQTASVPESPAPETTPETTPVSASKNPQPSPEDGRIVVRAKTNSWIQVRDDNANELLLTRLLRAGDSYAVPGRSGLTLSTGNAGALEILVDGSAVPPIGGEGDVKRKVRLDAEKLKAGTAASE